MLLPSSVLVKIPPAGCRVCLLVLIGKVQWENQKRLSELVLSSGDPVIPSFLSPLLSVVFFFFSIFDFPAPFYSYLPGSYFEAVKNGVGDEFVFRQN